MIQDFLQEALMMKNFKHPNVLSLIGISIHEEKPCALMPLMSNGDLKIFLIHHKVSIDQTHCPIHLQQYEKYYVLTMFVCNGSQISGINSDRIIGVLSWNSKGYGTSSRERICSL